MVIAYMIAHLGTDSDVVFISGVILIKSMEECQQLFDRAHSALLPAGLIIIQDYMRVGHTAKRAIMGTIMDSHVLIAFDLMTGDQYIEGLYPGSRTLASKTIKSFHCPYTWPSSPRKNLLMEAKNPSDHMVSINAILIEYLGVNR